MASPFTSTTTATTASAPSLPSTPKPNFPHSSLSFRLSPKPNLRFFTKGSPPCRIVSPTRVKAQLDEVSLDGSSNAVPPSTSKSEAEAPIKPSAETSSVLATQETISQFITQVASLVKLVDSRDIVELQLKQNDCEVTIRKKDALPQPPAPAQPTVVYSPPTYAAPPAAPASTPTSAPAPATPAPSSSPPAVKSDKSSRPPLKSPMTGTFYRSPGPGEPPFVKVGDKVKKGQVLCIIEAMKLMNEIEADQTGTIIDIIAEDGKPVSVDTPLFVIEP